MPEWNCLRSTPNFLAFFETFQSEQKHRNTPYQSNHRHKVRFQDVVYLKLNKWRAKIQYLQKELNPSCKTDKKIRNLLYYFLTTQQNVSQKLRKVNMWKWVNHWFRRRKCNQVQQKFHSLTISANIWETENKSEKHR